MSDRYRLLADLDGDWVRLLPLIGAWNDAPCSIAIGGDGAGERLVATARPATPAPANTPVGPGIFALRWFECLPEHAAEFIDLSADAWPAFEDANPGTRIFGLFRAEATVADSVRFLLLTRYPSLAGWDNSRQDTGSPPFRRRHQLTRRSVVSIWRLANSDQQ